MQGRRLFGIGLFLGVLSVSGCDVQKLVEDIAKGTKKGSAPTASIPAGGWTDLGKNDGTIAIGSFNIQVFGQSKLEKPKVMQVLSQVVRRFDVIAIQELRAKEQDIIPRFLELINEDGSRYDFIIGPRLGRTASKEQYVYLYDANRIEVLPGSVYTAEDPEDHLHREPLVATFRVRTAQSVKPFTFTLINVHTDPDEVQWELGALDDVFVSVQRDRIREDDVIMLGDFNADEYHLGPLGKLPGMSQVITGQTTNTKGTESYDNVLFDRRNTVEFTGRSGVLNLREEYGLSMEAALEVSDHLPIWATFNATENAPSGTIATRPTNRQ
jgi:endonuclease/exonuclease/phosphatase family metal-dependent hydrolase